MSWFQCPGCDKMVTALVHGTGPNDSEHISKTHCCLFCQRGEGCRHLDNGCAGVPGAAFRQVSLADDMKAHYLAHVPAGKEALPAILFLHGGFTYKYPETLWHDVCNLVEKNSVVKERFVVIAPFATIGEPVAVVSSHRTTKDRFGNTISYVDDFDVELVWKTFMQACQALDGRVDMSRLSVVGFSMGGQSSWNVMLSHGSKLAAAVPFSGCCSWAKFDPKNLDEQVEQLSIRSYCGMEDSRSYSWKDFTWLAQTRGLETEPSERHEEHSGNERVTVYEWSEHLQLCLMTGNSSSHCCWDAVFYNEDSFHLFTWLERQRLGTRKRHADSDVSVEADETHRSVKRKITPGDVEVGATQALNAAVAATGNTVKEIDMCKRIGEEAVAKAVKTGDLDGIYQRLKQQAVQLKKDYIAKSVSLETLRKKVAEEERALDELATRRKICAASLDAARARRADVEAAKALAVAKALEEEKAQAAKVLEEEKALEAIVETRERAARVDRSAVEALKSRMGIAMPKPSEAQADAEQGDIHTPENGDVHTPAQGGIHAPEAEADVDAEQGKPHAREVEADIEQGKTADVEVDTGKQEADSEYLD